MNTPMSFSPTGQLKLIPRTPGSPAQDREGVVIKIMHPCAASPSLLHTPGSHPFLWDHCPSRFCFQETQVRHSERGSWSWDLNPHGRDNKACMRNQVLATATTTHVRLPFPQDPSHLNLCGSATLDSTGSWKRGRGRCGSANRTRIVFCGTGVTSHQTASTRWAEQQSQLDVPWPYPS